VIRHYNGGMQVDRFPMVVQAVLKGERASLRREKCSRLRAKGYEDRTTVPLVMREAATILITPEGSGGGYEKPHRYLRVPESD